MLTHQPGQSFLRPTHKCAVSQDLAMPAGSFASRREFTGDQLIRVFAEKRIELVRDVLSVCAS